MGGFRKNHKGYFGVDTMNKIFKVIWNNAKHCYVVASELAKGYSRGGGSRTIRRAMVTLGVVAAVYVAAGSVLAANSGGHLDGNNYIGDSPYNVTIDSDVNGYVYGHKENSEKVEEASVTMTGGWVHYHVYGGYSSSGAATSNSVTISDGTIGYSGGGSSYGGNVYGGYSVSGNSNSNSVNISGEFTLIRQSVCGGYSSHGAANSNSVIISGGSINKYV